MKRFWLHAAVAATACMAAPLAAQVLDGASIIRGEEQVWQDEHIRWQAENIAVAERLELLASRMRRADSGPMAHDKGLPSLDLKLEQAMALRGEARAKALETVVFAHARMRAAHEETRHAHSRILELVTALEVAVADERASEAGEKSGARP